MASRCHNQQWTLDKNVFYTPDVHGQGDGLTDLHPHVGLLHHDGGRGGVWTGQATLRQAGEVVEVTPAAREVKWAAHVLLSVIRPPGLGQATRATKNRLLAHLMKASLH